MHASSSRISATTIESATHLPKVLSDLISDYTETDFSMAFEKLTCDAMGDVIDTPKNQAISEAMKEGLISSQCDPKIKRKILECKNLRALRNILEQIQKQGYRVNLDNTDLSGCNLSGLNLSHMSARGASFSNTNLYKINLKNADLTGATFTNIGLIYANLSGAILINTTWRHVKLLATPASHAILTNAAMTDVSFMCVKATGLTTNDPALRRHIQECASKNPIRSVIYGAPLTVVFSTATGVNVVSTNSMRFLLRNSFRHPDAIKELLAAI